MAHGVYVVDINKNVTRRERLDGGAEGVEPPLNFQPPLPCILYLQSQGID